MNYREHKTKITKVIIELANEVILNDAMKINCIIRDSNFLEKDYKKLEELILTTLKAHQKMTNYIVHGEDESEETVKKKL